MGHMSQIIPLARHDIISLCTKYESIHYKDIKGDEKCKNWGGLGVRGTPKSSAT